MDNNEKEQERLAKWQHKLLPTIVKIIISLAVFFFVASLGQLIYLQQRVGKKPEIDKNWIKENTPNSQLYQLEYLSLQNRYHQGNTTLMSRIWLQYLGFMTGMILTIIGAIFILGKLREPETKVELSAMQVRLSLLSTSPGLVMVILGTVIMITTIIDHYSIDVRDANIYLQPAQGTSVSTTVPEPVPSSKLRSVQMVNPDAKRPVETSAEQDTSRIKKQ
jgi:hypothetical protein